MTDSTTYTVEHSVYRAEARIKSAVPRLQRYADQLVAEAADMRADNPPAPWQLELWAKWLREVADDLAKGGAPY